MEHLPIGLAKLDGGKLLQIDWSDGLTQKIKAKSLRAACPCATCREKHGPRSMTQGSNEKSAAAQTGGPKPLRSLTILSEADLVPLAVDKMAPAGSYAYNIGFSDGHKSGLFTFELLRNFPAE